MPTFRETILSENHETRAHMLKLDEFALARRQGQRTYAQILSTTAQFYKPTRGDLSRDRYDTQFAEFEAEPGVCLHNPKHAHRRRWEQDPHLQKQVEREMFGISETTQDQENDTGAGISSAAAAAADSDISDDDLEPGQPAAESEEDPWADIVQPAAAASEWDWGWGSSEPWQWNSRDPNRDLSNRYDTPSSEGTWSEKGAWREIPKGKGKQIGWSDPYPTRQSWLQPYDRSREHW